MAGAPGKGPWKLRGKGKTTATWVKEGRGVPGRGRVYMTHLKSKRGVCMGWVRGLGTVCRSLDSKNHGKPWSFKQGHDIHSFIQQETQAPATGQAPPWALALQDCICLRHITLGKDKYPVISLISGIQKNDANELIYKTETDSQTWKTNWWIPRGTGWGGINEEYGINRYTILYES